jgi:hypothetical protein
VAAAGNERGRYRRGAVTDQDGDGLLEVDGEQAQSVGAGSLEQAAQRVGPGQRHVAVQDQRGRSIVEMRQRLFHRVAGAELRRLARPGEIGCAECGLDLLAAMTVDHDDAIGG